MVPTFFLLHSRTVISDVTSFYIFYISDFVFSEKSEVYEFKESDFWKYQEIIGISLLGMPS